ncbi:MAG: DNA repair exonuclease [Nanoarchaeota archaeon]
MKYAHLADLHLGSWRDLPLRDLSTKAFLLAMDDCVQQQVDFILFAGDIFNTSLPSLDTLKIVTKKLKELKDYSIPVYVIPGSHDFSPSGKTMIDVLEHAGLVKNVCKGTVDEANILHLQFTQDQKTGAKLTGIPGRKGQLDRSYYEQLALEELEQEPGYKIFLFHTSLTELKPKHLENVESYPASFLPKRFNYYAGGHLHHRTLVELPDYGPLTYPGALFPNNFLEVEKYSHGGYFIITAIAAARTPADGAVSGASQTMDWRPVVPIHHHHFTLDCSHKTPEQATAELEQQLAAVKVTGSLVTLRLSGMLEQGKVADLPLRRIMEHLLSLGAYSVLRNTAQLQSPQFEEVKIASTNQETIEEELIREHQQQNALFPAERERQLTKTLLTTLNTTRKEGETMPDFQARVEQEIGKLLS